MGEVYRARDTRLGRDVAIKVLPTHLSSDPDLKQRFEREARSISSLNHPNICHLYDVGSQDGINFIIMEYLEGENLADRLRNGPLALQQALKIGVEIAGALDKAHRQGITHRDLKPGNIMLTKSGAKLMDFGLAKTMATLAGAAPGVPLTPSAPTMSVAAFTSASAPLTEQGTIIGTFLYMAPEILQGKEADARSDIFSFGCVLYEMVTGIRPFAGNSQLSAIAAILERDPEPITNLQPLTPPPLEHVVLRCLTKDPDERWQTSHDLVRELKWVAEGAGLPKPSKSAPRRRETFAWGLAAVCIALMIWLGLALRSTRPPERQPLRLSLLPPQSTSFVPYNFSISPDGQRLAFVAVAENGGTALWVRSLASGTAQQLTGTEGAKYPFWSPDSRKVGFFSAGKLKSVDPSGSAVQIICDTTGGLGGTWNDHGTIVFAQNQTGLGFAGLMKVSASGGEPQPATEVNASNATALWPSFLPDGNHFLYFVSLTTNSVLNNAIFVGSLSSRDSHVISREISGNTQFASGRLFYVRDRSLMAQPFDLDHLQISGRAESVAPQELEQDPAFSRAGFSASNNGVVLFQSASDSVSRLSWFDRGGKELGELPTTGYRDPALSRDGTLLAVSSDDERNGKHYIHIYDFARGTSTRISNGGSEVFPVLSPTGRRVSYVGNDAKGSPHIYVGATDGSSEPESLLESNGLIPNDWSPDGRYLVYMNFQNGPPELDLYDFQKHSSSVYGSGSEAQFSPDSSWVAFTGPGSSLQDSDVFLAHFPGPGGRIQISNHGGAQARWRADGKELFYVSADKKLMAVSIDASHGRPVAGLPHALFQTRIVSARTVLFQYAVSSDGKRFLINSLPLVGSAPLTVLMN